MVIMKKPEPSWMKLDPWHWPETNFLWIVMEFKFLPFLKIKEAKKDISKLRKIKKSNSTIERAYFFSIDKNKKITSYLKDGKLSGDWCQNYYREGRGIIDDKKEGGWNFYIESY